MHQVCLSISLSTKATSILVVILLGWCSSQMAQAQVLQTSNLQMQHVQLQPASSQGRQTSVVQVPIVQVPIVQARRQPQPVQTQTRQYRNLIPTTLKTNTPRQVSAASPWTQPMQSPYSKSLPYNTALQNAPLQQKLQLNYTPQNVIPVQYNFPAPQSLTPQTPDWFGHSSATAVPHKSNGYLNSPTKLPNPLTAPNPRLAYQVNHSLYKQPVPAASLKPGLNSRQQGQFPAGPNRQTNLAAGTATKPKKKEYSTKLEKGTFTEYSVHRPQHDSNVRSIPFTSLPFVSDPDYSHVPFMPAVDASPYTGKYLNPTQRPWVEFGRGLYRYGEIPESSTLFGETNLLSPSFLVYGDYRAGMGYVKNSTDKAVAAHRLNLDFDLKLTDTERIHAFWGPLDRNGKFNRIEFDDGEFEYIEEYDANFDTFFFEGDLGSVYGGLVGEDAPFDMPIALGYIPLLFQNGIWLEDAFLGAAVTVPARNSRVLDWVNYDLTFFAGFNDLTSPALRNTGDGQAHMYGATAMIDAYDGYVEAGYAYIDHRTTGNLSYHNMSLSYTKRYKDKVSSAVRLIVNAGQEPDSGTQTADGQMILWENSFITSQPLTFVPYANFFVGFDRTQSVARAGGAGGILRNTGINFETDGLTGYPTLDATGQNTYGGAVGLNWLGKKFDYQLVLELATVQTMGSRRNHVAPGDQYALGARYQVPLNHAWLFRADVMHGILDNSDDISGIRTELRWKF